MPAFVSYIPIATTIVAACFAPVVFLRWKKRQSGPHLLWWSAGILLYGVGTFTESWTTLFGWQEPVFRAWYISGALLGGAPLAQGTVYLMFSRKVANRLSSILVTAIVVASVFVILSPINYDAVEAHRLTGRVMEWRHARLFSPFINTYAAFFLIGGAAMSAWRFRRDDAARHRFIGNVFIALGALLPGIGGMATRFGHTEVLYIMEFLGLVLIWIGYRYNVKPGASGAPDAVASRSGDAELSAAT
jgi:hypothetical protein